MQQWSMDENITIALDFSDTRRVYCNVYEAGNAKLIGRFVITINNKIIWAYKPPSSVDSQAIETFAQYNGWDIIHNHSKCIKQ